MNLQDLRENYTKGGLYRDQLHANPLDQLQAWLKAAHAAGLPDPNAMTLATASPEGIVTARTVLLKGLVEQKLQFFTNYHSKKAQQLAANPHAALTFHWKELERQICLQGTVTKTSRQVSEDYFMTRPYESQIGAWVSEMQSSPVESRLTLEDRALDLREKYPEGTIVPCPPFWGGYDFTPTTLEFWQGRTGRLHDRFQYQEIDQTWHLTRLSP